MKHITWKSLISVDSLTVGGIATALIPLSRGFWGVTACITFYSFAMSGYMATVAVMLLDLFGRNSVVLSYGFMQMLHGLLKFVYPPLLGKTDIDRYILLNIVV